MPLVLDHLYAVGATDVVPETIEAYTRALTKIAIGKKPTRLRQWKN